MRRLLRAAVLTLPLVFAAGPAWAAVTLDATTKASVQSAGSLTWSHTVSGSSRLLIVGVTVDDVTQQNITGVTYAGTAMTKIGTAAAAAGTQTTLWQLVAPATGANNVVATSSISTTPTMGVAMSFNGVDQTTPVGTPGTNTNTNGTSSVTIASTSGNMIVDAAGISNAGGSGPTVGGSQTLQQSNVLTGTRNGGSTAAGAASVAMTWSWGVSDNTTQIAVEVKAAGAAASFGSVGSFCTANHNTASSSWTFTTNSANLAQNNIGVIVVATDNFVTTDGNTTTHLSITDAAGNTWTKAREFTKGNGK